MLKGLPYHCLISLPVQIKPILVVVRRQFFEEFQVIGREIVHASMIKRRFENAL
jgi:hypothetical protein